jgi:hypothetical protein
MGGNSNHNICPRCNFSDTEIEMFFCRYDIDGNVLLDRHETNKALGDFGEKKIPESRPGELRPVFWSTALSRQSLLTYPR